MYGVDCFQRRDDCLDYRGNERYSNTRMNEFGSPLLAAFFRRECQFARDASNSVLQGELAFYGRDDWATYLRI
jgi:hypothetical protein